MPNSIQAADADDRLRQLMLVVTRNSSIAASLEERRYSTFKALFQLLDVDAGHWAWGRGHPLKTAVAPLAIIHEGYSPQQLATLVEHSLKPEAIQTFQARAGASIAGRTHGGWHRRAIFTDAQWKASTLWSENVARLGLDSFAHAVNYTTNDTWSCLHFMRKTGRAEFTADDALLCDLALTGIVWLNAQAEERVPPEVFTDVTPRQRTVMLMLLDGMSRKQIATSLQLSPHTVDDHIKAIYTHFEVSSVGELAARFMKLA